MSGSPWQACGLLALALLGCSPDQPRQSSDHPDPAQPERSGSASPGTAAGAQEDGEWRIPAKNYASTRFSGLDQINIGNVARLQPAFTFSTGVLRGHEAVPIVAGNTMYVVTPHPNTLYALDLTRAGALKWRYDPGTSRAARGVACCDVVNRGAAYADGRVFFNTLDAHTVAVDAESGKELWKVKLGEINRGESMTMAPLVVGDKVYVGNSGGEFGVRGWITALNARTGKILWRAYSTGPDQDLLIGARFRPFYAADRTPNLGVSTWPADQWKIGGGAVWGWVSYDPGMNAIFYGTSNPGTWNPALRPGDNKIVAYISSLAESREGGEGGADR